MGVVLRQLQATALALIMAGCCTPRGIETTKVQRDTVEVVKVQRDSVERWHTRTERVKGDTVWRVDSVVVERWRERWRDSTVIKRDTVTRVEVQRVEARKACKWGDYIIIVVVASLVCLAVSVSHKYLN